MGQPKGNIIVIDGEPVVRTVITSILENAGFAVSATDDINAAIQACMDHPPNLVLTNVLLPGITGHDAMNLIRARCPNVPVLMVSGLPAQPVIRDWINRDGFDVFPKPFTADTLVRKVEEMMTDGKGSTHRAGG